MSDERLASDVERILAQRLAAVFSEHKRDMGGEIVREIERGRAEADARWMEATGLPAPRGIDDWLRLAAAVGVPAERILNGDFAPRDVKLIAEGLRLRNKAGTTPEPSPPVGKGKRSKGRRKPPVKPLTAKQAEAVQIVGECKGNIVDAARKLGKDPATVRQAYQAAMAKLGQKAPVKHQTKAAPTDRRGGADVSDIDDARRGIDSDEARRFKRR